MKRLVGSAIAAKNDDGCVGRGASTLDIQAETCVSHRADAVVVAALGYKAPLLVGLPVAGPGEDTSGIGIVSSCHVQTVRLAVVLGAKLDFTVRLNIEELCARIIYFGIEDHLRAQAVLAIEDLIDAPTSVLW